MVQLTTEQRIFIVLQYNRNENTTEVQNAFPGARFPDREPPRRATILRNELATTAAATLLARRASGACYAQES